MVFLIVSRRIPDVYPHLGGTHVHHLNYGIGRAATLYGVGLALTFDEFGLWLHLGGGYWQRASFAAPIMIDRSPS